MTAGRCLGLLVGVLVGCAPRPEPADLILHNARVYTLSWPDPSPDGTPADDAPFGASGWSPDAEAVAIRAGRIVFVGTSRGALSYHGPATDIRDLEGATVLPGLIDSHTHVTGLGANLSRVDLRGVESEQQVIARLMEHRAGVPSGEWIVGYGWDEGAWAGRYPTWDLLSARFPDNPVILNSLHGFVTWGNRRAFDAAGITASTIPPVGGEIVKDARGALTGILLNRASGLLAAAMPRPQPQQTMAHLHVGLLAMAEAGYAGVHEAGLDARAMQALTALEKNDQLPIRVYAMLSARDEPLMREWLERGPDTDTESMLRTRSVKAYYDGALGSRGARLLDDYTDQPGHRGVSGGAYGFDEALVTELMTAGFQVAIHAIGDAGNRETLDFLERVASAHPPVRANRNRIEHAQVLHPSDIPRFAELAVIASMEPPHAVEDMSWAEERLGPQRLAGAYAWRTLRQHDARLIFNSDLTGSDHSIFYGLHAAVTRRNKNLEPPHGWRAEEALRIEEAIRAYTTWPAYAAFLERETGVVAAGRWGDLTVMDIDPLTLASTDPARLLDGEIVMTVVEGEVVFDRTTGAGGR